MAIDANGSAPRDNGLTESGSSKSVGFRLDSYHLKLLEERTKRAGTDSYHLQARAMVIDALNSQGPTPQVEEDLARLRAEIRQLRSDLVTSVEAILIGIASQPQLTVEHAKEWVRTRLLRE